MAPARPSPSGTRPKPSRACQSTNPRRSARIQKTSSPGAPKGAFDRSEIRETLQKISSSGAPKEAFVPETRETAEPLPLDPPAEQGAGRKRKRNEDFEEAEESSSISAEEQGIDRERKRSKNTKQPAEHTQRPLDCSSPVQIQEQEAWPRDPFENARSPPFAELPREEIRRPPTFELDDEAAPQSYFTGPWHKTGDPVDHWVKHDVWPPNFAESIEPESEEMTESLHRTPSSRRLAKQKYSRAIWDIDITPKDLNAQNTPDTRARLLKEKKVKNYFKKHSEDPKDNFTDSAKETCRQVLESSQSDSSFTKEYFDRVIERVKGENEAKVVRDIGPLVVPSVEPLYYEGNESLKKMTESVDKPWSTCVPVLGYNAPTPDYAAGFRYGIAFTKEQQSVLDRFMSVEGDSLVQVAENLCFPFLVCEAKGADGSLTEAEQQSVEDVLIASRGVIELFRRADLAEEIHLKIIAFSVIYNDDAVKLYGHVADIRSRHPKFYRHLIKAYFLHEVESASYNMITYIYKVWAQDHWKNICRAIDTLATMPGYTPSTSSQASFSVSGNMTPQSGSMGPPLAPRSASLPRLAPRPTSSSNVQPQGDLTLDKPTRPPHSAPSNNARSRSDLTPDGSPTRDKKKSKKSEHSDDI